ncbi:MAG: hypothetical protein CMP40_01295 [Rickettsiales bacterium]|nr:hypothetical protein [Rickettsiales bacterium]
MRELNTIEAKDIYNREDYKSKRKNLRSKMVSRKKNRRIDIGPCVTLYFENRDTIIHQINEMVFIENGGDNQIREEIDAYKSLVPEGNELVATVMVEIDNPIKRSEFLGKMGGFEQTLEITINKLKLNILGKAELDVDRTTDDGKASSVQFVHFIFDSEQIKAFKSLDNDVQIAINHRNYKHSTFLSSENISELSGDFSN